MGDVLAQVRRAATAEALTHRWVWRLAAMITFVLVASWCSTQSSTTARSTAGPITTMLATTTTDSGWARKQASPWRTSR